MACHTKLSDYAILVMSNWSGSYVRQASTNTPTPSNEVWLAIRSYLTTLYQSRQIGLVASSDRLLSLFELVQTKYGLPYEATAVRFLTILAKYGARGGTRTPKAEAIRPSNVRVCQFHHSRAIFSCQTTVPRPKGVPSNLLPLMLRGKSPLFSSSDEGQNVISKIPLYFYICHPTSLNCFRSSSLNTYVFSFEGTPR